MNKKRLSKLEALVSELESISQELEEIRSEEEEYVENVPDNLQGTERYEQATSNVDIMEEVSDTIGEAICNLNDMIGDNQ